MIWRPQNQRIEIYDEEHHRYVDYCEEVKVLAVYTDILTKKKNVLISLYDSITAECTMVIPRSCLNSKIIPMLADYGLTLLDTPDDNANIQQILYESAAQNAVQGYKHDRLGFCEIDNSLAFLAHHPIGVADPLKSKSEFVLPEKTKPLGTLETWKAVIETEVIGHPNMELALSLSALAPVAHLLKLEKVIALIPIVAFIGRSSTGKTVSLKTLSSVWGSPEESFGMISDLNATQNAFFAQLGNTIGLPSIFDETSAVPEWDFTKIIYNLPKGRDKLRCDGDGKVRLPIHYSGAIILSGEKSLFSQTNESNGLSARLLEITLPWTADEYHADRLEYGVRHNYGTAVYPLMEWLLAHRGELEALYREEYALLKQDFVCTHGIEDRMIKTYALIAVSARVMKESLDLTINLASIRSILLDIHRKNKRFSNTPEKIFEKMKQWILENYSKFPPSSKNGSAQQIWGEQGVHKRRPAFWISVEKFDELMDKLHGDDFEDIRYELHKLGWMERTKDRHYKLNHKLGDVDVQCYCLYLNTEDEKLLSQKTKNYTVKNLLLDDEEAD